MSYISAQPRGNTKCVDTAKAIGAKICVLHHHDPKHDDAKLDQMYIESLRYAKEIQFAGELQMAIEGKVWNL
jgi:hypothetical protein